MPLISPDNLAKLISNELQRLQESGDLYYLARHGGYENVMRGLLLGPLSRQFPNHAVLPEWGIPGGGRADVALIPCKGDVFDCLWPDAIIEFKHNFSTQGNEISKRGIQKQGRLFEDMYKRTDQFAKAPRPVEIIGVQLITRIFSPQKCSQSFGKKGQIGRHATPKAIAQHFSQLPRLSGNSVRPRLQSSASVAGFSLTVPRASLDIEIYIVM